MRCPKCQYISFDSGERCRNCGYDFSLTVDMTPPDLRIQDGTEALGPLADLSLRETTDVSAIVASASGVAAPPGAAHPRPVASTLDLPLFKGRQGDEDAPLVAPGAPPRPPLAVRRGTPIAPKARPRREPRETLELDLGDEPEPRLALETAPSPGVPAPVARHVAAGDAVADIQRAEIRPAGAGARILAAIIDVALIGGIDLAVLYLTLRLCDLRLIEAPTLPLAPFAGFLLLLNGGYFASFIAAGGQTIGKMATGIRVVSAGDPDPKAGGVSFGHALLRAVAYIISALPAGLGFIPALVGSERRALHDWLADTRVIKA